MSLPDRARPFAMLSHGRCRYLSSIDSVAGCVLATPLLTFFFYERLGVRVESIAALFCFARVANAGSHTLLRGSPSASTWSTRWSLRVFFEHRHFS